MLKGMCATLSKDLNTDMVVVPCYPAKWTDEQILKFVHQYPELSDLATDLEALKASDSPLSAGTFTDGHENVRAGLRREQEEEGAVESMITPSPSSGVQGAERGLLPGLWPSIVPW